MCFLINKKEGKVIFSPPFLYHFKGRKKDMEIRENIFIHFQNEEKREMLILIEGAMCESFFFLQ